MEIIRPSGKYIFEITGREATLFAESRCHVNEAVEEFLYRSGFVTSIRDASGGILVQREPVKLELVEISAIRPSQFYISTSKLALCKRWIRGRDDVMIPIAWMGGEAVALDGHTRMRAALDLGYRDVYTYCEDAGEYIPRFVNEAAKRGVMRVADMEVLCDEDYEIKWHRYCDDFFGRSGSEQLH